MGETQDEPGKGIDRRELFKRSAIAAGAGAAVWAAPRIETLGFAPASAASGIVVTSPSSDDKNQNGGGGQYCAPSGPFTCCGSNWGNNGNNFKEWTFATPKPGCTQVVVRLIPWDCTAQFQPDIARSAVQIVSQTGTCNCSLFSVVLKKSNNTIDTIVSPGPACAPGSLSASFDCGAVGWDSGAKLAVQIQC